MKLTKALYDELLSNDIEHLEKIWDEFEGIIYEPERTEMKRLFFDMDGVLATWQTELLNDFVLPSGEVLKAGSPVTDELWNNPTTHYYASIPPYERFVDFINNVLCKDSDFEVFILSKSPSFAIKDKLSWLDKYLPNVKKDHILLCPYGEFPKTNFLDHITKDDFLFDDYSPNLREWDKVGGFAVNVLNRVNHLENNFYNISNDIDLYDYVSFFSEDLKTDFENMEKEEIERE